MLTHRRGLRDGAAAAGDAGDLGQASLTYRCLTSEVVVFHEEHLHYAHDIVRLMKMSAPSLLPLFRSQLQGDLLALVLLHPDRSWTLTGLAGELGASHTAVLREVDRLIGSEILAEERVGRTRVITARTDTVLYRPLCDLLLVTYGPLPRLSALLADLDGIDEAYIYGSWAARHSGVPGPIPADVDVLVVGRPDPDELFDLAERASRELRREVNVHRVAPEAWASPSDEPFLTSVRGRPLVRLHLREENGE